MYNKAISPYPRSQNDLLPEKEKLKLKLNDFLLTVFLITKESPRWVPSN